MGVATLDGKMDWKKVAYWEVEVGDLVSVRYIDKGNHGKGREFGLYGKVIERKNKKLSIGVNGEIMTFGRDDITKIFRAYSTKA